MSEIKTILSFGGGVDTTAILHMPEVMKTVDEVIFADTGGEHPETYEYMEKYSSPFIKKLGIPFTVVRGHENADGVTVESLEEACLRWKIIPSRMLRFCTEKFKLRPIKKYLDSKYPGEEIHAIIGIAWDEAGRINDTKWKDYKTHYPLVDSRATREHCKKIIKEAGWPVPPKSGCYYCPFQRISQWKDLRHSHPDLWERAIRMEENGSRFPEFLLSNFHAPLREVHSRLGMDLSEFIVEDEECGGVCFV